MTSHPHDPQQEPEFDPEFEAEFAGTGELDDRPDADEQFGYGEFDTGEFGSGPCLWDGDEGTLDVRQRDCLVVLLKNEYISADLHPTEYRTLRESPGVIRSALNNLYLELRIDEPREIAYKRPVRSEERTFRTLLHDTAYNREETLLLVFLREQFRAGDATGASHVYVDVDQMHEYVARFRPARDTDEHAGRRKVDNAIKSLRKTKLITDSGTADRYQVSHAIETLLGLEKLHLLLDALKQANGHDTEPAATPDPGTASAPDRAAASFENGDAR